MSFKLLAITKQELLIVGAALVLGIIIGSSIINLIIGSQLDQLLYDKKKLIAELNNQQTKLNKLEKNLAHRQNPVVQNLKINITTDLDKHSTQNIKEKLFNMLNSLIGRKISAIDTELLATTLEDRIITIEDTNYKLNLLWLVVHPTTTISFTVTEEKN
ncbi:MAG: hypothetical protein ACQERJ_04545 [Bacillota bacterium]